MPLNMLTLGFSEDFGYGTDSGDAPVNVRVVIAIGERVLIALRQVVNEFGKAVGVNDLQYEIVNLSTWAQCTLFEQPSSAMTLSVCRGVSVPAKLTLMPFKLEIASRL